MNKSDIEMQVDFRDFNNFEEVKQDKSYKQPDYFDFPAEEDPYSMNAQPVVAVETCCKCNQAFTPQEELDCKHKMN